MWYETVWKFETARFTVELRIHPEDMDPILAGEALAIWAAFGQF